MTDSEKQLLKSKTWGSDDYLKTIDRLEPDITSIDAGAYYASAAISLKRIADQLTWLVDEMKMEKAKTNEKSS